MADIDRIIESNITYRMGKCSSKCLICICDGELSRTLHNTTIRLTVSIVKSSLTRSKLVMVVFVARCFKLVLSNTETRVVCQKLTYIHRKTMKIGKGLNYWIFGSRIYTKMNTHSCTFLRETVSWKSLAKALERVDKWALPVMREISVRSNSSMVELYESDWITSARPT